MTPEQSEQLKLLHERTKVPISVYIREGIDLVLKQYEALLPGQITLISESPVTSPVPPSVNTTPKPGRSELSDKNRRSRVDHPGGSGH
jgi:hypothetical protein